MWWLVLMGSQAWADTSAQRICKDIEAWMAEAPDTESVITAISEDPRSYDPQVALCLCEHGAPTPIQQAARRRVLQAHTATQDDVLDVPLADELTSPSLQVATMLAADIRKVVGDTGRFTVHLTRDDSAPWLSSRSVRTSLGAEFPTSDMWGARTWPQHVFDGTPIPSGPLAELLFDGRLATHGRLHAMSRTTPRFLWLDLKQVEGEQVEMHWAMQEISPTPPHALVSAHRLRFVPVFDEQLIAGCPSLGDQAHILSTPPTRRPWWTPSRTVTAITTGLLTAGFTAASVGQSLHARALEQALEPDERYEDRPPRPYPPDHEERVDAMERAWDLQMAFTGVAIGAGAGLTLSLTLPRRVFR